MARSIDESGQAESEHGHVFSVEEESSIDDIQEEWKIACIGDSAGHSLEHGGHQLERPWNGPECIMGYVGGMG